MDYMTTLNLQKHLKSKGLYKGALDGIWGRQTEHAVTDLLETRRGKLAFNWRFAVTQRNVTAAWQLICAEAGFNPGSIDGYVGPSTRHAIEELKYVDYIGKPLPVWRDDDDQPELPVTIPNHWPVERDVEKFYGKIGANQTLLTVPYAHHLSWSETSPVKRFSIHEKCHDSALRVLNRVLDHYGPSRIAELSLGSFSGCLNPRLKRGSKTQWSMHSWGIAIDYDEAHNQLKWGRDRARFAKPDYDVWWKLWEEEGWLSLGRAKNYDWMHVQAARLS